MIDTSAPSRDALSAILRTAAGHKSNKDAALCLRLSAEMIEQLGQERDRLASALQAATTIVVGVRDGYAESGSRCLLTESGDVEPIPGTMDEETAKTVAGLDHFVAEWRNALAEVAS